MSDFKDKIIYQIYPRSFKDSNQDGIGDLKGIIQQLDYLQELGIDYIWITPFFVSPQRDNGYDIADYLNIDPLFGSMNDLEQLVLEAEQRNISIMLDMVFNHTSIQHTWFKRALNGEKKYQDYYIFKEGSKDTPPTNWESKFGGSAWEYVPHLGKWYLHLFDVTQADLNWNNKLVRDALKQVILFWKSKGIKGFRFDVINLISKPEVLEDDLAGDGRRFYTDGPLVHEYLKEIVRDTGIESLMTVGEMSSTSMENCILYSKPEEKELTMCFHFHHLKVDYLNGDKWEVTKPDILTLKKILMDWQMGMQKENGWNAVFWCNHDQPRVVSRFGDDKRYWKESAKMLATSIHLLRGTPYIYQGEELGMTNAYFDSILQYRDVESLNYYQIMIEQGKSKEEALSILAARSRDNARTPMLWSDEKYAGFSEKEPWISIPKMKEHISAAAQKDDNDSILHYYKKLIHIRKTKKVIADGMIDFIYKSHPELFAYKRFTDTGEIIVINNFSNNEIWLECEINCDQYQLLLSNYPLHQQKEGKVILQPYESVVYEKI